MKIDGTMDNRTIRKIGEAKAKCSNELAIQKRAEIDAEFAQMENDTEYLAEIEVINEEFAQSDWEALQLGESQQLQELE